MAGPSREVVLVNTHLLFPHQPYFSIIRLRELRKILGYLELYHHQLDAHVPIVMCGDFNGSPSDPTCTLLSDRNFSSPQSVMEEKMQWVTHRTHEGHVLCCDYIFVQNPSQRQGPIETHWQDYVFRSTKQRRLAASRREAIAYKEKETETAVRTNDNIKPIRNLQRERDTDTDRGMVPEPASTPTATAPLPKVRDSGDVTPQGVEALVYNDSDAVELKEYRFALENLGFANVVDDLSDTQLHRHVSSSS
jgi:hypothetical protein